jgi:two-component system, NarL family, nitrate/nitrite response regulator NarL
MLPILRWSGAQGASLCASRSPVQAVTAHGRPNGRGKAAARVSTILVASVARVRRRWLAELDGDFSVHEVAQRGRLEWSVATLRPDVLLLDLTEAGLADLKRLLQLSPQTKIVLCSRAPNEEEAISALKAGARGYHYRDSDPALIRKAVEKVREGEIWVARSVVARLLKEIGSLTEAQREPAREEGLCKLSRRERDITDLILSGGSNKGIAERLGVTEATVKAHLTSIFRKLKLHDRLHLALFLVGCERNRTPKLQ